MADASKGKATDTPKSKVADASKAKPADGKKSKTGDVTKSKTAEAAKSKASDASKVSSREASPAPMTRKAVKCMSSDKTVKSKSSAEKSIAKVNKSVVKNVAKTSEKATGKQTERNTSKLAGKPAGKGKVVDKAKQSPEKTGLKGKLLDKLPSKVQTLDNVVSRKRKIAVSPKTTRGSSPSPSSRAKTRNVVHSAAISSAAKNDMKVDTKKTETAVIKSSGVNNESAKKSLAKSAEAKNKVVKKVEAASKTAVNKKVESLTRSKTVKAITAKEAKLQVLQKSKAKVAKAKITKVVKPNLRGKKVIAKVANQLSRVKNTLKPDVVDKKEMATVKAKEKPKAIVREKRSRTAVSRIMMEEDEVDSSDMDEDKRNIRETERALRSLSGEWEGPTPFFTYGPKPFDEDKDSEAMSQSTFSESAKEEEKSLMGSFDGNESDVSKLVEPSVTSSDVDIGKEDENACDIESVDNTSQDGESDEISIATVPSHDAVFTNSISCDGYSQSSSPLKDNHVESEVDNTSIVDSDEEEENVKTTSFNTSGESVGNDALDNLLKIEMECAKLAAAASARDIPSPVSTGHPSPKQVESATVKPPPQETVNQNVLQTLQQEIAAIEPLAPMMEVKEEDDATQEHKIDEEKTDVTLTIEIGSKDNAKVPEVVKDESRPIDKCIDQPVEIKPELKPEVETLEASGIGYDSDDEGKLMIDTKDMPATIVEETPSEVIEIGKTLTTDAKEPDVIVMKHQTAVDATAPRKQSDVMRYVSNPALPDSVLQSVCAKLKERQAQSRQLQVSIITLHGKTLF